MTYQRGRTRLPLATLGGTPVPCLRGRQIYRFTPLPTESVKRYYGLFIGLTRVPLCPGDIPSYLDTHTPAENVQYLQEVTKITTAYLPFPSGIGRTDLPAQLRLFPLPLVYTEGWVLFVPDRLRSPLVRIREYNLIHSPQSNLMDIHHLTNLD